MAKRKPPSQRSERQLDETAKALARTRDEAKAEKDAEAARLASEDTRQNIDHTAKGTSFRKSVTPTPFASTKRPKNPGS